MKLAVAALVGCALLSVAVACGSGSIEAGVRVVLEADLSQLPEGADRAETMNDVREVLERRLKAFNLDFEIDIDGADQLTVTVADVSPDEARDLVGKTAELEFRAPVREDSATVVCENADGSTYAVAYLVGLFMDTETGTMACPPDEQGTAGVVKWEPATGTDSQGVRRVLTGSYLKPNASVIGPPTTVAIEFTGEGGLLFEQITGDLVGLPLAIFLDEELISAPTVQQQITGGSASIGGLTAEEAKTLAILLNAGALPVPVRAVSLEEIP
jgi:preprotein translocase subunit SecD